MSTPSSSTSPASEALGTSWCMRLRMRRNVDLPQPDGPISAVTSPAAHGQRHLVEHHVIAEPGRDVAGLERGQPRGLVPGHRRSWAARSRQQVRGVAPVRGADLVHGRVGFRWPSCSRIGSCLVGSWGDGRRASGRLTSGSAAAGSPGRRWTARGSRGGNGDESRSASLPQAVQSQLSAKATQHEQLPPQHDRQPGLRVGAHRVLASATGSAAGSSPGDGCGLDVASAST